MGADAAAPTAAPRCRFCGGPTDAAFTTTDRNRGVSDTAFQYRRCRDCSSYSLANVPPDLDRYYPSAYYALPLLEQLEDAALGEAPKLEFVKRVVDRGHLIEIGAGTGQFSHAARRAGFDVTAIEMDERCCDYIESVIGARTICSDAPQDALAQLEGADAVTLWHVLEHLPEPGALLSAAAAVLRPGGALVLAMPNPQALQFRLLRKRWAHVDAPRHLTLIPYRALERRLAPLELEPQLVTTSDPFGRHWNCFGWEYALRVVPARHPSTRATRLLSQAIARALAPVERRGMQGTAYTAVFLKCAG